MLIERSDGAQDCLFCGTTIPEGTPVVRNDDIGARPATMCAYCVDAAQARLREFRQAPARVAVLRQALDAALGEFFPDSPSLRVGDLFPDAVLAAIAARLDAALRT